MITASFQRYIEQELTKKAGRKIHINRIVPVSGGSINATSKLETTGGHFFLKANDAFSYPAMFEKEAAGLELLRSTETFVIPQIILQDEFEDLAFLLLSFIRETEQKKNFWEEFGSQLANLHGNTSNVFGYEEDNYIGSLVQSNRRHNNWPDFFITERLEFQLASALKSGKMDQSDVTAFNLLFRKLDTLMPKESPALLHGDLWNGNFMVGENGLPCLIDPAVYYGHREMDLAMTRLFGGFDDRFYQSYDESLSLTSGFEERKDIYNLYPLLVHVNLFGGKYVNDVRSIVKRYV